MQFMCFPRPLTGLILLWIYREIRSGVHWNLLSLMLSKAVFLVVVGGNNKFLRILNLLKSNSS